MTQPKSKLLRNTIIVIAIAVLIALLAVWFIIEEYNQHQLDVGVEIYMGVITTIVTLLLTITLVTANTILVLITKTYTDQTARMAEETRIMACQNQQIRKDKFMPFFIPGESSFSSRLKENTFRITNIGEIAIFVTTKIICDGEDNISNHNIIKSDENINCITFKVSQSKHFLPFEVHIFCHDKVATKYLQIIKYDPKSGWVFDASCLPEEQGKIPPWAMQISTIRSTTRTSWLYIE